MLTVHEVTSEALRGRQSRLPPVKQEAIEHGAGNKSNALKPTKGLNIQIHTDDSYTNLSVILRERHGINSIF